MPAAARSITTRSVNVLDGLRNLREAMAAKGDVDSAMLLNDAVVWIKDTAETIGACEEATRLLSDVEEFKSYLLDSVKVAFPAFESPRLISPTVTIHCGSTPLLPTAELPYRSESHLGEVRGDALLRFELHHVSASNGEATYSVTLIERDDPPRLTAREAGLAVR